MMWIIDGDAEVVDGFDFSYVVPECDKEAVHVWRSTQLHKRFRIWLWRCKITSNRTN